MLNIKGASRQVAHPSIKTEGTESHIVWLYIKMDGLLNYNYEAKISQIRVLPSCTVDII